METSQATLISFNRFRSRQQRLGVFNLYQRTEDEPLSDLPACRPLDHSMSYAIDDYVTQKLPIAEIQEALFQGQRIEIHGIYPAHAQEVLELAGYTELVDLNFQHNKRKKNFNFVRPSIFRAFKNGRSTLVLTVTPGRDYVRHYGAIVRHYIAGFTTQPLEYLLVRRYPDAENALCDWTGLNSRFVRDSDRVILGYVEELVKGFAQNLNLQATETIETDFFKSYRYDFQGSSVILLGVKFSFWGNMSALISQRLCELGAQEIIYVAKLGALTSEKDLYQRLFSPSKYLTMDYLTIKDVTTTLPNQLLRAFPELDSGFHASVPTVLEEDYHQREALVMMGAQSIDNEISQMAAAIVGFNRRKEAMVSFSCLHFATDYLRGPHEKGLKTEHDLSRNRSETAVALKAEVLNHMTEKLFAYLSEGSYGL